MAKVKKSDSSIKREASSDTAPADALCDQGTVADVQKSVSDNISQAALAESIKRYLTNQNDSTLRKCRLDIIRRLEQETVAYKNMLSQYSVIYLLQDRMLVPYDADAIYRTLEKRQDADKKKPILLILDSGGGHIEPAYFIGKMLREQTDLEVVVPRRAKSAATLICCAASHIHMGSLSELGPIDPQINGVPALGLKNAIQHLAELASKYPDAVNLFIGYMCKRVEPLALGYYERVVESSMQYAERLLEQAFPGETVQSRSLIARKLTYEYKDHGFVIDKQEADKIFPSNAIKVDTEAYQFSNVIHKEVRAIKYVASMHGFGFSMVGTGNAAIDFYELKK